MRTLPCWCSRTTPAVWDRIAAAEPGINYEDVLYHGDASFGHVVGLPQKSCTPQLRYNKELFVEAGLPHPGELY